MKKVLRFAILLLGLVPARGIVGQYFQDFGAFTSGTTNTRSAFLLPDLDPGQHVAAFSPKWNVLVGRRGLAWQHGGQRAS
jgi:hypothetical protein